MRHIFNKLGIIIIILGILIYILRSSVSTIRPDDEYPRDLFGFPLIESVHQEIGTKDWILSILGALLPLSIIGIGYGIYKCSDDTVTLSGINMLVKIGENGEVVDLHKNNIHNILISGQTNTGKTTLLQSIYKQLKDQNSNQQIGFLVADITMIDFLDWVNDPYLVEPVIFKSKEALDLLDFYISHPPVDKSLIIHIEECDLMYENKELFETLWEKAAKSENVYIFFSTSRPSKDVITMNLLKHTHLKIIFKPATEDDSNRLLDNNHGYKLANHGEAILAFKSRESKLYFPISSTK